MLGDVYKMHVAEAVNSKASQRLSKHAPSLRSQAFDDEDAARRCLVPDRLDRFIGR
jgi:hypothetical protein